MLKQVVAFAQDWRVLAITVVGFIFYQLLVGTGVVPPIIDSPDHVDTTEAVVPLAQPCCCTDSQVADTTEVTPEPKPPKPETIDEKIITRTRYYYRDDALLERLRSANRCRQ
jgi:hypothetical protein